MSFRFREFKVYSEIKEFIKKIYIITSAFPKDEQFGLTNQLRRAAVSIALNIAEGSDRGSDKEFNRFIQISIGSVNEVVAALDVAFDNNLLSRNYFDELLLQAEVVVKQLSSFSRRLKGD